MMAHSSSAAPIRPESHPSFQLTVDGLDDLSLAARIGAGSDMTFNDDLSYSRLCTRLSGAAAEILPTRPHKGADFESIAKRLKAKEGAFIINTPWGGVVGEKLIGEVATGQEVEKYLVIEGGKFLAYEKHEKKWERLEVCDGCGIILWREPESSAVRVGVLSPGAVFEFNPGVEHAIIAGTNLLVHEKSNEPKGMDNDLIFLFNPIY